jgi:hypothetical protein
MGIEPITYHLQGDCSTVELHRQTLPFKEQNAIRLHDYTKTQFLKQALVEVRSTCSATNESIRFRGKGQAKPTCIMTIYHE